jgi:hypothetical protein
MKSTASLWYLIDVSVRLTKQLKAYFIKGVRMRTLVEACLKDFGCVQY